MGYSQSIEELRSIEENGEYQHEDLRLRTGEDQARLDLETEIGPDRFETMLEELYEDRIDSYEQIRREQYERVDEVTLDGWWTTDLPETVGKLVTDIGIRIDRFWNQEVADTNQDSRYVDDSVHITLLDDPGSLAIYGDDRDAVFEHGSRIAAYLDQD